MEANVDDLINPHPLRDPHTDNTHWTMPLLLATLSILVTVVIYYCAHAHLSTLLKCCTNKEFPDVRIHNVQNSPTQLTTPQSDASTSDAHPVESGTRQDFASYAIHHQQHTGGIHGKSDQQATSLVLCRVV